MKIMGIGGFIIFTLFLVLELFWKAELTEIADLSITQSSYKESVPIPTRSFSGKSSIFAKPILSIIPTYLSIPKINVSAAIDQVGLNSDGTMDVPLGLNNVGWFYMGPRPGEIGNAVIDGHYGIWKNGDLGVFNNLSKLQKGDKIYVKDQEGSTIVFIVRELRIYSASADASKVFVSNDGGSHLNLITCQGVWDKIKNKYLDRLVVFSDREILN